MGNLILNESIYNIFWHSLFKINYPKLNITNSNSEKLRLILGVGRSGTTWIANTLTRSKTPLRYFEEPLFHIRPKLCFSKNFDQTAIGFQKEMSSNHRLVKSYLAFTLNNLPKEGFLKEKFFRIRTVSFSAVLIKEVHALLATEALVKNLLCPALLVLREPIRIIDSLFDAQSLNTIYLKNEYEFVKTKIFLKNYVEKDILRYQRVFNTIDNNQNIRSRNILQKYVCILLIQEMFTIIAEKYENVKLIKYEEILRNPDRSFNDIADFFQIEYEFGNYNFSNDKISTKDHYSLNRDINLQLKKPFRFLKESDISNMNSILEMLSMSRSINEK